MNTTYNYFAKLLSQVESRQKSHDENNKIFMERLIQMMRDYSLTLGEAIEWDMEGFHTAPGANEMDFEYELDYYFWSNGLDYSKSRFYSDIVDGRISDIELQAISK